MNAKMNNAGVVKLANTLGLNSSSRNALRVRFPSPVPINSELAEWSKALASKANELLVAPTVRIRCSLPIKKGFLIEFS